MDISTEGSNPSLPASKKRGSPIKRRAICFFRWVKKSILFTDFAKCVDGIPIPYCHADVTRVTDDFVKWLYVAAGRIFAIILIERLGISPVLDIWVNDGFEQLESIFHCEPEKVATNPLGNPPSKHACRINVPGQV
jgi:hypothetical protein